MKYIESNLELNHYEEELRNLLKYIKSIELNGGKPNKPKRDKEKDNEDRINKVLSSNFHQIDLRKIYYLTRGFIDLIRHYVPEDST